MYGQINPAQHTVQTEPKIVNSPRYRLLGDAGKEKMAHQKKK